MHTITIKHRVVMNSLLKNVLAPMENQIKIVNVLGDAAPLDTKVSRAHSSLNVVVQALKTCLLYTSRCV